MQISSIPTQCLESFRRGGVIPAQPLALNAQRKLSERHQRALTRYYVDAGASGLAVGVHSTQFEIRDPAVGLFEPVLTLASETIDSACSRQGHGILKIAGVCGRTPQAVEEALFARATGYHACLLSLAALKEADVPALVAHPRAARRSPCSHVCPPPCSKAPALFARLRAARCSPTTTASLTAATAPPPSWRPK